MKLLTNKKESYNEKSRKTIICNLVGKFATS